MDRYAGPPRESVQQSSPPPRLPVKRKSSDREPSAGGGGDAPSKAERKQNGSVFSRISFPAETGEPDRGGTGKRKKTLPEPPTEDHHERERERPIANGYLVHRPAEGAAEEDTSMSRAMRSATSSGGRRRGVRRMRKKPPGGVA